MEKHVVLKDYVNGYVGRAQKNNYNENGTNLLKK
jgi:hypothetical protein